MTFTIEQCLQFGWRTFKARPWFFVGVVVLIFLAGLLSSVIQGVVFAAVGKGVLGRVISFLISLVINTLIGIGSVTVFLKSHDAVMSATWNDLWRPSLFWKYLGTYLILAVVIIIGFILLIVPGVIALLMFMFATSLVVDKGLMPIEALKESARITKGHRWKLLGFVLVLVLVNLVGLIALVVGLLVSIPVSALASIHAYRELSGMASGAKIEPLPTPPPAPVA